MKSAPVKRHRHPAYPTKLEVQCDPRLLRQNIPPAWRAVPEIAGAVALFLAVESTGCRSGSKTPVVAPLFEHGEGRGATGCIVVAPPVFLSEEEAMQVIREEAGQHGLTLSPQKWTVPGVKLAGNLWSVDAVDLERKVAVKFVSQTDHNQVDSAREEERFMAFLRRTRASSVTKYDLRETGRFLATRVRKQAAEKVYLGTLYDPGTRLKRPERNLPEQSQNTKDDVNPWESARTESKRLLRLQVQDFVKWLQAQGAI